MIDKSAATKQDTLFDLQVYIDLYQRSKKSVFAYFALFWLLITLTPFIKEQRALSLTMGLAITLVVACRLYLAINFSPERYHENPSKWKVFFISLVYVSAILWGILNVLASAIFGLYSQSGVFSMIITCGIIAGGANSLAPSQKAMMGYIALMIFPYIGWSFFKGDIGVGVFMILFTGLFLVVTKESHKFYVTSVMDAMTLARQSEEMANTVNAINTGSENLRSASQDLTNISQALKISSDDMSNRIGDIEQLSMTMKSNADAVSLAASKTSGNVNSVSGAIENITSSIDQASKSTDEVMRVTSEAVDQALVASEKIDILKKAAQEIGKITEIISDISDQTNLLALNATIEAARAGEAGKGFAVVANEIKALAQQTAEATAKIKSEVEGIQNSTESSAAEVKDISQVISSVKDQVASLSESVTDQRMMSDEIVREIEEMTASMTDISQQVDSNASLVEEMGNIITQARTITDQVLSLGADSNNNANNLFEMARNLSRLSESESLTDV